MLNIIRKLFQKNKEVEKSNDSETNSVTILVDSKEPYIHMSITNIDNSQIENFARMLYELNNGLYAHYFMNILMQLSLKDKDMNLFTAGIIKEWSILVGQTASPLKKEPLIKPTNFNRKNNE